MTRYDVALRDSALLALLIGCGLRRSEAANARLDQWRDLRQGRYAVCDIAGKHGRVRTVVCPEWAASELTDGSLTGTERSMKSTQIVYVAAENEREALLICQSPSCRNRPQRRVLQLMHRSAKMLRGMKAWKLTIQAEETDLS